MNTEVSKQEVLNQESRYEPMSVKDWLITLLIMIVPTVNLIMLIIWSASDKTNINKQNWARAGLLMAG